jgi:hypothetical protein
MTKQMVKNSDISTNLKNLPKWKFLDQRQRNVWGKENEWWLNIWTINDCNYVITSDTQEYIRNKFKSRSSQSSHATSTWNKMLHTCEWQGYGKLQNSTGCTSLNPLQGLINTGWKGYVSLSVCWRAWINISNSKPCKPWRFESSGMLCCVDG